MSRPPENTFLDGPLGPIYVRTALPIILIMGMNGLLAVTDALFLGWYVGSEALAAVTLMFPLYMAVVALATLVSTGMSSILARHLGGNRLTEAQRVFAGAHGLALVLGAGLNALFLLFGSQAAQLAAGGSDDLAVMGLTYLRITVLFSPLLFLLSVNSDALRNEGRVGFVAAMSLLVSVSNIGFNFVLIAGLDLGVAGSAYGTALAQALAFAIILTFRMRGATTLRPQAVVQHGLTHAWRSILALGAPQSLSFVGLALGSAAIMTLMIAAHFQAIGDARRAAALSLSRTYLFAIPLTFALPAATGEVGIWIAGPAAEVLVLGLTALVLGRIARARPLRWGLFQPLEGERA